jgi:sugar lactone lactonase YvrE
MKRLLAIAGIIVGASASLMAQNNVSVYTIKDLAGALPPTTATSPNSLPLQVPDAVYADKDGSVYVTDTGGHKVWKIGADGKVTIVLGTGAFGGPTSGKAANTQAAGAPSGLVKDADGNLFVADRNQARIFKIDSAGVVTLYAGATTNGRFDGDGRLATLADLGQGGTGPRSPVIGPDGSLYFADTGAQRIRRIDKNTGIITTVAGAGASGAAGTAAFSGDGGLATLARLSGPEGVAFDSFGNMYIADTGNNRIRMVDTSGIITTIAGRDLTNQEKGLDDNGNPVKNPADAKGGKFDAASAPFPNTCAKPTSNPPPPCAAIGDGRDPLASLLAAPSNIVVDANNNIIFADRNNDRIRELVANSVQSGTGKSNGYGAITTIIGTGAGGNAGDGNLGKLATVGDKGVTGLALDANGKLYFTDRVNNRVRVFDPTSGLVSGFAGAAGFNGDGPCAQTQFNNPTGIAIDGQGNTYVADTSNNIIRKIDSACNVTTIAGIVPRNSTGANAGSPSAEGVDALSATLNQPTGIAVDASGTNIYFVDIGSNRVRKIANGVINTVAGCVYTKLPTSNNLTQNCNFTADGLPATIVKLGLSGGTTQNTKRFTGVALDSKGNVYFTEPGNNLIRKLLADGTLTTIAGQGTACSGGDGGPAVNMCVSNPSGIAVDKDGNIFFADTANFAAHMITANGIALPLAGQIGNQAGDNETTNGATLPAWARRYRAIQGVAVDNKGNAYLTDSSNNKVDRIPYAEPAACFAAKGCPANSSQFSDYRVAGNLANSAGEFVFDYSAPASATALASTVQLSFPTGLAVDSKGDVIFADTANNLVREAVVPSTK